MRADTEQCTKEYQCLYSTLFNLFSLIFFYFTSAILKVTERERERDDITCTDNSFFVNKVTFTSRHITSNCCLQIMMNLFRQFDYKIMHLNVINNMLIECDRQINDWIRFDLIIIFSPKLLMWIFWGGLNNSEWRFFRCFLFYSIAPRDDEKIDYVLNEYIEKQTNQRDFSSTFIQP